MNNRALFLIPALGLFASGCATKDYVHDYVAGQLKPVQERLALLEKRDEALEASQRRMEAQVAGHGGRMERIETTLKAHEERITAVSRTAQEALERAQAAGRLAEGKLLYEVVLTDDTLRFKPDQAVLNDEARTALDAFAERIKREGKPVYVEIQGHTDSRGEADYNERLGLKRAEAVRAYLHRSGGLPLARMSTISYGESAPIADNRTAAGRAKNRRVVLVVLR
ncbi:MAG: OmpA family protein [Burkholderiales bacterium]|nr:OmpA family protein [Burkholderiales bacterium]